MKTHPNCKINLGLHVTERRPDGYHNIETVFVPVDLCDELEINRSASFRFAQSGIPVGGDPEQNLCVKAYRLLQHDFPQIGPVNLSLDKRIPFGAGLGGGSSDAAFVLSMLNEMFLLGLSTEQLERYAARLGADCAFFIENRPCYAEGKGDVLSPVPLSLEGYWLLLLKPSCGVSTAEAYRGLTPRPGLMDLREAVRRPLSEWPQLVTNHFETTIFALYPQIAALKDLLYSQGALYASMSGSGSTVYGIFDHEPVLPQLPDTLAFLVKGR